MPPISRYCMSLVGVNLPSVPMVPTQQRVRTPALVLSGVQVKRYCPCPIGVTLGISQNVPCRAVLLPWKKMAPSLVHAPFS